MENIADLAQIKNIMNPLKSIFFFGKFILDTGCLFTLFLLDIVPNYSGTNDPGGLIFLYRTGLKTTRKRGA